MLIFNLPFFLLALPAPLLIWIIFSRGHKKKLCAAIIHPQTDLLIQLNDSNKESRIPWLWLCGCILLITAMGRPQWVDMNNPNNYQGHNIILAIDTSESMRAIDYRSKTGNISRLDIAKLNAQKFIQKRTGDRIGLIQFADSAQLTSPMTINHAILHQFVDEIEQGILGEKTALGDAIIIAVNLLTKIENKSRLLILFTDGSNTAGKKSPIEALTLAMQHKVRIYTIAIGHEGLVPFPRGPIEKPLYTELPMNMGLLLQIANNTGGRFFHASDSQNFSTIINEIQTQEPLTLVNAHFRKALDIFWIPLLIGLLLISIQECRRRHWVTPI